MLPITEAQLQKLASMAVIETGPYGKNVPYLSRSKMAAELGNMLTEDVEKYFHKKRGLVSLTTAGQKMFTEVQNALSTRLGTNSLSLNLSKWGAEEETAMLAKAAELLTKKTEYVSVVSRSLRCEIDSYSIVGDSSRVIENNESQPILAGCFSHLWEFGMLAFKSKGGKYAAYKIENYTLEEIKMSDALKLFKRLKEPENQDIVKDKNGIRSVYIPSLDKGAVILTPTKYMIINYGRGGINNTDNTELALERIRDYHDKLLVVCEDMQTFEMIATATEI